MLDWITDSGVAAICADNYAVEAYPARTSGPGHSILPLHHHCLFKLGVPLAELWYLKDLADWLHAQGRNRFLLTAPPLRLPGAVGSPVTPIATVYHRPSNHRRRTSAPPATAPAPSNHFNEHRARLQRYCRHLRRSPGCAGRRRSRARLLIDPDGAVSTAELRARPPRWPPA